jgi:hypothetical protein
MTNFASLPRLCAKRTGRGAIASCCENLAMLRKIHGTNFSHIKFLDRPNIKCQNGQVLPPAQVFYFNGQALQKILRITPLSLSSMDVVKGNLSIYSIYT